MCMNKFLVVVVVVVLKGYFEGLIRLKTCDALFMMLAMEYLLLLFFLYWGGWRIYHRGFFSGEPLIFRAHGCTPLRQIGATLKTSDKKSSRKPAWPKNKLILFPKWYFGHSNEWERIKSLAKIQRDLHKWISPSCLVTLFRTEVKLAHQIIPREVQMMNLVYCRVKSKQ